MYIQQDILEYVTKRKMGKKLKDKNIRKLTRLGKKSLAVTLPIEGVTALRWKEKQKVVVKKIRGGFIIRDWKK